MDGERFGKLTVVEQVGAIGSHAAWKCRCDCGREVVCRGDKLKAGLRTTCGVYECRYETAGMIKSEWRSWYGMHERCRATSGKWFRNYVSRGIKVCERWGLFENFLMDMGAKPSPNHQIDRIDNDRGYEPGNCRWATRSEQRRNCRDTIYVEHDGQRRLLVEVIEEYGLTPSVVYGRLRGGWSLEDALNKPVRAKRRKAA